MTYDATVIEQLADNLYKQAATVERLLALAGAFMGLIVGIGSMLATGESGMMIGGGVFLAAVGGVLGFVAAKGRAFALRAQAQQLLCQVAIEKNTRATLDQLRRQPVGAAS